MHHLLWTFPVLMVASVIIGWAAEITAIQLSAGMALAILAWLQCAPEFAVEASIAWQQNQHLALANLTGSLRLLLGAGLPGVFFIHWFFQTRRNQKNSFFKTVIELEASYSVEAIGLMIPVLYFLFILLKGVWNTIDGVILCSFYGVYFWLLNLERKAAQKTEKHQESADDEDGSWVTDRVMKLGSTGRWCMAFLFFAIGGLALVFVVHPFVEALKEVAWALGVSQYVFIQWIAPIASELPEKITAFNWARKNKKVSMAVVNMLSSVNSQWTLLAGLIPIVFTLSSGHFYEIHLDMMQRHELWLTLFQSAVAIALLFDLKIRAVEALGLFILWAIQFFVPNSRSTLIYFYGAWFAFEMGRLLLNPKEIKVLSFFRRLFAF